MDVQKHLDGAGLEGQLPLLRLAWCIYLFETLIMVNKQALISSGLHDLVLNQLARPRARAQEICINQGDVAQTHFWQTGLLVVLQAFRWFENQVDGSIPRSTLGKQHGETLPQTLRGTKITGGRKNVSDEPVSRTAVLEWNCQKCFVCMFVFSNQTSAGLQETGFNLRISTGSFSSIEQQFKCNSYSSKFWVKIIIKVATNH